jgi:uncharacterized small protein (DUF1192 family)
MDASWLALLFAIIIALRVWDLPKRLAALQEELARRQAEHNKLYAEMQRLREQLAALRATAGPPQAAELLPASPAPRPTAPPVATAAPPVPPAPLPVVSRPAERSAPATPPTPLPTPKPVVRPEPVAAPEPVLAAAPVAAPPRPVPPPEPTGPTWWERASTVLLENWTGILGAVVLVTGVGFLGIYTALRMAPPYRFLLICAFAGGLLGARWALRTKAFAQPLSGWLLSSAAAIFLFACVGAVSIEGLRWVAPPFDYLLLLAGVSVNLYLAWRTSRQEVATLHGVLSLVALAVLPPTALTLGTAAGVTAFCIAITYRQQWRYQLLLSIASFFAFHLYWHHELPALGNGLRLAAMGLVLLVGGVAAVVQYRRVYARRRFEPLLFAAHLLNWTCLGINLYLYSTGSVWKTIPLALGAGLTFWAGRRAKQLGIGWLFQTDTIISLLLALGTALSLQGWHATATVIALFMLLESLLVALIMARQNEALVYRVAMAGALLAATGLLLIAGTRAPLGRPFILYRDALLLALAGWAGLAFVQLIFRQPLLLGSPAEAGNAVSAAADAEDAAPTPSAAATESHRQVLGGLAGLAGLLQAGAGLLLARVVFGWAHVPVAGLLAALVVLAGAAIGLARWVRVAALAPDWVRWQQLVLGQFLVVLAVLGLHELGLSWLGVALVLYAESLLATLLLSGRAATGLLRAHTHLLVLQAAALPWLVRYLSPGVVGARGRAALLVGAALFTLAYQLRRYYWRRAEGEFARLSLGAAYQLPLLGVAVGWLLLGAGAQVYARPWAGWAAVALLGSLLYLRRRVAAPGLWAGLALAAAGYLALQWEHVLHPVFTNSYPFDITLHSLPWIPQTLLYLLPTVAVPLVGLATSWWPAAGRYVRWPWLYLLGAHLAVAVMATATLLAYFVLGLLGLAVVAFVAAQAWRRTLPDITAVVRAGQPDRYLLHVAYALLLGSFVLHLGLPYRFEWFFGQPAEYFTAAFLFGVLAALALTRPPATEPIYKSWRWLHRWLPEAALLFGSSTLAANIRTPWQPLIWISGALLLSHFGPRLPLRFRRLGVYGRLYYGLAAGAASVASLLYVSPGYILRPEWWALAAAVALLFGYVALALRAGAATIEGLSPAWDALARPARRQLEAALLYPAFLALSLLLIQSFDRSVLTVLLMLEVVAVFSTSLLLRRQDLRYVSLAGMLGCLVRLVFFDLSQSGTITRAIVFIFMGLLLLGMNALYARFKDRFGEPAQPELTDDGNRFDERELNASDEPIA